MKKSLLITLLLFPLCGQAQYTIGRMDSLIRAAIASHQSTVTIPPGEYRGNTGGGSFIWIQNASNLQIIADSVKMICEKRVRALEFTNCANITLQGLTIDYDSLTFTQGDVVAVGSNYVDIKIHAGYPVVPWSRMDIVDPLTRYRKRGTIFAWHNTAQVLGGDTVRITNTDNPNITTVTQVGDLASLSAGAAGFGAPHTLVLSDCQGGMVLKNVTVHCGPGFGIFESGGQGGSHLDGCKVVPGPRPAGATQDRLLSVSWDAIQHKLTRTGPLVENCVIKDAGDDSWSVTWDNDYTITAGGGSSITVTPDNLQVGDSLRASLSSDVVYITAKSGNTLTLNKTSPWSTGTHLYSPSRRCEHFILRNNYIHSPGRVLIKAGHGLVENNTFDNMFNGVTVHTELGAGGATGINSLVIRNNDIKGSGHFMSAWWNVEAGAICILNAADTLSPAGSFDSIYIEKNKFTDISGVNIVVTSASNVHINENDFYSTGMTTPNETGGQFGIPQRTVVYLKNNNNVTLDSNVVHTSGLDSLLITTRITNLVKLRKGIFDIDRQQFDNVTPYCCHNAGGNAFDNNLTTFVDAAAADSAYTGLDFHQAVTLDSIRFYPRSGFEYRMNGGKFQGSNDGISYTTIYTIPANPPLSWSAVAVTGNYQYVRYLSPDGGYCNVAEIQVIKHIDSTAGMRPALKLLQQKETGVRAYPNPVSNT
jgi:Right handed beta helix region